MPKIQKIRLKLTKKEVELLARGLVQAINQHEFTPDFLLDPVSTNHLVLTELFERKRELFESPKAKNILELKPSEVKACFHLLGNQDNHLVVLLSNYYQQMTI
jgi:hypothetical protein